MNTVAFDTHAAVKTLREAGADEAMAEAIVNTASAAAGAGREQLATKADLDTAIADLRADLYRALWMQGGALAAIILAAKLL